MKERGRERHQDSRGMLRVGEPGRHTQEQHHQFAGLAKSHDDAPGGAACHRGDAG